MLAEILEKTRLEYLSKKCIVGNWIEELPEGDKTAVQTALSHKIVPSTELMRIFKDAQAPFKISALKSHRSGDCTCQN